jgi:hypothetical protein
MSLSCPDRITLTGSQRRALARLVRAGCTEQRLVTRAQIVLCAAEGQSTARIAASLRLGENTVRKGRHRWARHRGWRRYATRHARAPTGVQCGAGREGQGGGVCATGRCQVADVAVELPQAVVSP